jgi:glycosyltransferase involved in cell wall biosynthesis
LAIYVVTPKTGRIKIAAESSPRVTIVTDAADAERVPQAVRLAADLISTEDLSVFRGKTTNNSSAEIIAWVDGDQLLLGSAQDLRHPFFSSSPATTLVPVHLPCIPEADLIGVQPRLIRAGALKEIAARSVRIRGATNPSALVRTAWKDNGQPWALLHLALLREQQSGGGIEALKQLWQKPKLEPLIASLVLRNMIVALLRQNNLKKAEELLTPGVQAYADYADLHYLTAILWLYRQKPSKAVAHLERAMQTTGRGYVGGGGENSYRSSYVLGEICERLGDERRAVSYFMPGAHQRPAFALSIAGILRQRFSRPHVEQLNQPLCELVRREPSYLEAVFDFFVRHRVLDPPRRLLRTLPLADDVCEVLQEHLSSAEAKLRPKPRERAEKPGVVLQGSFLAHSGHARINRNLGLRLLAESSLDAALEPSDSAAINARSLAGGEQIAEGLLRNPSRLDLSIRHSWPPNFRPPEAGRLACIVPWEHHAVPRAWVSEIERSVDELWVPSQFVAQAFVSGGVDSGCVHVIPNGFATDVFNPKVAPWRPTGCRSCVFLFVGGTIRRKGVDLLMQAYADAFSADDDVTLIFKDSGASSFYLHNNLLLQIQKVARTTTGPSVIVLKDDMDDPTLASLYRGCDAFVLPYRGEGFGMPLMEAMACGKPVVTTAAGPALEFCSQEFAYLIPAAEVSVPDPPPPIGEFTSEWTWFEPDLVELAAALRAIYENREEAARRGSIAAERIAQTHAWPQVTQLYLDRVAHLTGLPAKMATQEFVAAEK